MAFNIAFTPCETDKEYEIFCFASPVILPIFISLYIHHWFINKRKNLFISYSKAFLTAIAVLFICLSFATFITNIVETYLQQKHVGTEMYNNYFEIKCGCDDYQLKALLFSLLMSTGTFTGGLLMYGLAIFLKKIKI